MKAKFTQGKSFKGLVKYQTKAGSTFIASSCGRNEKYFIRSCTLLRRMRPDISKPVLHFSLALPEGEVLSADQWADAIDLFLSKMGLAEHDYFAVRHSDTKQDHVHLNVPRIHTSGKRWDDSFCVLRAIKATEQIEKEMKLTRTKTLGDAIKERKINKLLGNPNEIRLSEPIIQIVRRTGELPKSKKQQITQRIRREREEKAKKLAAQNDQNRLLENSLGERAERSSTVTAGREVRMVNPLDRSDTKKQTLAIAARRNVAELIDKNYFPKHLKASLGQILFLDSPPRSEVIDEVIEACVKTGNVPIRPFGTSEYLKLFAARAELKKVPVYMKADDKTQVPSDDNHQAILPPEKPHRERPRPKF